MASKTQKGITLDQCSGCVDDFYNHDGHGLNGRCWSFDQATPIKVRMIPIDLRPPYKHLPLVTRPSCFRAKGYVKVQPEGLTSDGYWKS